MPHPSIFHHALRAVPDYSRTFLNVTGDDTLNMLLNEGYARDLAGVREWVRLVARTS